MPTISQKTVVEGTLPAGLLVHPAGPGVQLVVQLLAVERVLAHDERPELLQGGLRDRSRRSVYHRAHAFDPLVSVHVHNLLLARRVVLRPVGVLLSPHSGE